MGENGLQNRLLHLHFAKEPLFLQCRPCSSQTTWLIIRGRTGPYGPIENHILAAWGQSPTSLLGKYEGKRGRFAEQGHLHNVYQ